MAANWRADVDPGTYVVTEDLAPGWRTSAINCSDADSLGDVSARSATIQVASAETVTCTFTNTADLLAVDDERTPKPGETVTVPVLDNDVGISKSVVRAGPHSKSGLVTVTADSVGFDPTGIVLGLVTIPYTITDALGRTSTAQLRLRFEDCVTRTAVVAQGESPSDARPVALRNQFTWCFDGTTVKAPDGGSLTDANSSSAASD